MSLTTPSTVIENMEDYCQQLASKACAATRALAHVTGQQRDQALGCVADAMEQQRQAIKDANVKDLEAGEKMGLSQAMLDRLKLDDSRIDAMAHSVRQIAAQPDPLGEVLQGYVRPNGLRLQKVRVPLGVVLIIFESRPNVTSDAAALCIKSGNAVILRGGKEAIHSNTLLAQCVQEGLAKAGLERHIVQLVNTTDRAAVGTLLKLEGQIDLAIPRGGKSLIKAVVQQAHIPVIKHYTGNCHVYVDRDCDEQMAIDICVNAKTQRPGVCNAAETLLFHQQTVESGLLKQVCQKLAESGVQIRGDQTVQQVFDKVVPATDADWDEEYLSLTVAIRVVKNLDEAIDHINNHGSKHTDAIVTRSIAAAQRFTHHVDTANAFVNCSTRFSDGGEYGLGAEIGISTDKLHARGPMGAADLTTYKWIVTGDGQIRN